MTTFSSCCPLYMVTLTTASWWWWWLLDKETCLKMDTLLFTVFTYSLQRPVSQTGRGDIYSPSRRQTAL